MPFVYIKLFYFYHEKKMKAELITAISYNYSKKGIMKILNYCSDSAYTLLNKTWTLLKAQNNSLQPYFNCDLHLKK